MQLIDLTHPLNSSVPCWGLGCGFMMQHQLDYQDCSSEVQFRVQNIQMAAGIGTHMDAPAHCIPGAKTIPEIPLADCFAPAVLIDISASCSADRLLTVEDILDFEAVFGTIEAKSLVIIYTGWSRHWNEPERYRNNLQFPSVSIAAAELLLARQIVGLGIDTLGPDRPDSGYPVHQLLLAGGCYLIENIANAHLLPAKNSRIIALALPITGGTESPVRLVGLIDT